MKFFALEVASFMLRGAATLISANKLQLFALPYVHSDRAEHSLQHGLQHAAPAADQIMSVKRSPCSQTVVVVFNRL
jgi:hypothetical protein